MSWSENSPLWLIWLVVAAGLVLAQECGYRGYRLLAAEHHKPTDANDGVGYIVSAVLALLGLLIAFTFSMSAGRYDARRALVVDEANALGTTYLRIQLLDDPARATLSGLLVSYGETRQEFLNAGTDPTKLAGEETLRNEIESRFWNELAAALRTQPAATVNPSLLETANQMFDLAATRRAALDGRVPPAILNALIIYALISALLIGYALASGRRRHFVASTTLFILVALSISLILDLDRPRSGSVTVSQAPLLRAIDGIRSMEAKKSQPPR